ncbi:hypothetical protein [Marinobacter alexandrii]|uniref:hypothetical protein n=1 Tax=Marinobacter alexandrii TaxID=2570351 RepID=UPI001109673F|nr:hypothetical protein [Marinobacter alexandrii]
MKAEPGKAYVYQPYGVAHGDKIFGVSGPDSLGFEDGGLKGLTLKDATEIKRFCNENPEFAASFVRQLRRRMEMPYEISSCGCEFESVLSNAVSLCDKCSDEHFSDSEGSGKA